jgi:hypothetical protein
MIDYTLVSTRIRSAAGFSPFGHCLPTRGAGSVRRSDTPGLDSHGPFATPPHRSPRATNGLTLAPSALARAKVLISSIGYSERANAIPAPSAAVIATHSSARCASAIHKHPPQVSRYSWNTNYNNSVADRCQLYMMRKAFPIFRAIF